MRENEKKLLIMHKKIKDLEELKLLLIQDKVYNQENGNERAAELYKLACEVVEVYSTMITYI